MHLTLVEKYQNEFASFPAFAKGLRLAFEEAGLKVNGDEVTLPIVCFWFNYVNLEQPMLDLAKSNQAPHVLMMYYVDSPLVMNLEYLENYAKLPSFNLIMPITNDQALLQQLFPNLNIYHVPWGCNPNAFEGLEHTTKTTDVVFAGSIKPLAQCKEAFSKVPPSLHGVLNQGLAFFEAYPETDMQSALSVLFAEQQVPMNDWRVLATAAKALMPVKNHFKRRKYIKALSPFKSVVYGNAYLTEVVEGQTQYGGEIPFDQLPQKYARAKVGLNLIPSQAVAGPSERIFEMAGSNCAVVSEKTSAVEKHFKIEEEVLTFEQGRLDQMSQSIQELIDQPNKAKDLSENGKRAVLDRHTWQHRLPALLKIIEQSLLRTQA